MREMIRRQIREHPLIPRILDLASGWDEPVFLVGGAIRDFALGISPRDIDFATGHPYEAASFFAERYGGKVIPLGKDSTPTYRIPLSRVSIDWTGLQDGSLESDLRLRDFTLNSIGYAPSEDRFYDPTGGFQDLAALKIRMTCPSAFYDDSLRILKAYRLFAQFPSLEFDQATGEALGNEAAAIMDAAPERLRMELTRLCESERAGEALTRMAESGVLFVLIPEMSSLKDLKQNDFHHTDVLNHTLEALQTLDGNPSWPSELSLPPFTQQQKMVLRLALLLHDSGKADTRSLGEDGRTHFYGHPKYSAAKARRILRRLCFSNTDTARVCELCLNHLRPLGLINTAHRGKAVRRLVHSMEELLPLLLALSYADKLASRGRNYEANLDELRRLSREVMAVDLSEGESLRHIPKLIDGLQACAILGMSRPGPNLGRALDDLMDRQVEGTVKTRAEATEHLRRWAEKNL